MSVFFNTNIFGEKITQVLRQNIHFYKGNHEINQKSFEKLNVRFFNTNKNGQNSSLLSDKLNVRFF